MRNPPLHKSTSEVTASGSVIAILVVILGTFLATSCLQSWLSSRILASNFISTATWLRLSGTTAHSTTTPDVADVPFLSLLTYSMAISLGTLTVGGCWLSRRSDRSFFDAMRIWGLCGWGWWLVVDAWEWIWIFAGLAGWTNVSNFLAATPQFWLAFCMSGWLTTLLCLGAKTEKAPLKFAPMSQSRDEVTERKTTRALWLACGLYVVVFTTMNWRLYFNLLIPHGDSAMYEEHLWNILHGKGFRSYLDQGLFLGEHIQFVHLFLLPMYVLWPSHLLLELCESMALALGAFPVFWMARRQTHSDAMAFAAAASYLLYSPMQFLDIEIDLKTFRPEAFGIPLFLLTLDQLERQNLIGILIGLALTLTVKEDYAIVFGPLGLWFAFRSGLQTDTTSTSAAASSCCSRRARIISGLGLSLFSIAYLWLATRVVMPWFRSGAEVHYARYFAKFGETPEQIVQTMVTQPGLLFGELCSLSTLLYALMMLAPLTFLPLLSPGRLAVGAPLFGILCLNELAKDPRHQFHAPLVAIAFWSLTGGLPRATTWGGAILARLGLPAEQREVRSKIICQHLLWTSTLCTGFFFSLSPLGLSFWDTGSSWYWKTLYGPSRRGELFARVVPLIPRESRVASTDFVHPRFTHYERSYDYSGYARKVAGNKRGVPDDTDYLVIDTNHRYSEIKSPDQIPEYHDQWELLPVNTEGYFIVLKRKR